jgi:transposase-like protein
MGSAAPAARSGGRREQLLALVVDQPGITVAQAGKQFGISDATGLYKVARRLQDDGLVRKRGAELHPTAKAQQR